jgi:hypothetical protein
VRCALSELQRKRLVVCAAQQSEIGIIHALPRQRWTSDLLGWQCRTQAIGMMSFSALRSVLPRRWVVKRTFAWLGQARRLARDYERLPETRVAIDLRGNEPKHAAPTCLCNLLRSLRRRLLAYCKTVSSDRQKRHSVAAVLAHRPLRTGGGHGRGVAETPGTRHAVGRENNRIPCRRWPPESAHRLQVRATGTGGKRCNEPRRSLHHMTPRHLRWWRRLSSRMKQRTYQVG